MNKLILVGIFFLLGCQQGMDAGNTEISPENTEEYVEEDAELIEDLMYEKASCVKATSSQISTVNLGNTKVEDFLDQCGIATQGSPWCMQLIRPNPSSKGVFQCTYGINQPHQLIHPNASTWSYAYQAVSLIERLEMNGIKVAQIYNWWRPEPYNKNVGGAAGRHPYGTSVDVRFSTKNDQAKAHSLLCKWRKQGELRALGYYSSSSLHLGIGDSSANTWGKSCP